MLCQVIIFPRFFFYLNTGNKRNLHLKRNYKQSLTRMLIAKGPCVEMLTNNQVQQITMTWCFYLNVERKKHDWQQLNAAKIRKRQLELRNYMTRQKSERSKLQENYGKPISSEEMGITQRLHYQNKEKRFVLEGSRGVE